MRALARVVPLGLALLAAAPLAACGSAADAGGQRPLVFAASSLDAPLSEYAGSYRGPGPQLSFAGSDQLAAQIRRGAPADLYAAADLALPARLHREGLVERPRRIARNRLVVAVPAGSRIDELADLAAPGAQVVIGDPTVPVGAYAREALARLPGHQRRAVLANVRSEEAEAGSVLAKLLQGAADAGFVYATDVAAAGGGVRALPIGPALQPEIAYAAAVVVGGDTAAARRFLDGLIDGEGAGALRRAGFLAP